VPDVCRKKQVLKIIIDMPRIDDVSAEKRGDGHYVGAWACNVEDD
jgi:hypothetical protein